VYGEGSARDCRIHVQKLNNLIASQEQQQEDTTEQTETYQKNSLTNYGNVNSSFDEIDNLPQNVQYNENLLADEYKEQTPLPLHDLKFAGYCSNEKKSSYENNQDIDDQIEDYSTYLESITEKSDQREEYEAQLDCDRSSSNKFIAFHPSEQDLYYKRFSI